MKDLKPITKSHEELLSSCQKNSQRVPELEALVEQYEEENETILAEGNFNDDKAVEKLMRNRVRIELAPRAIELAEGQGSELEEQIASALEEAKEALAPYYQAIDAILLPQAESIVAKALPNLKDWRARKTALEGTEPHKTAFPKSRTYFIQASASGLPTAGNLRLMISELSRVQKQHAELTKEAKKSA